MVETTRLNLEDPRVRAGIGAGLLTLALLGAVIAAALWFAPGAAAAPLAVYAASEDGELALSLQSVEIGARSTSEKDGRMAEETTWQRLAVTPGPVPAGMSPRDIASGGASLALITDIRITFSEVGLVDGSVLQTLYLPQPELHVRLPDAGRPGDALLLLFDLEASIVGEAGYQAFRPSLAAALWTSEAATNGEVPERPTATGAAERPRPPMPVITMPPGSAGGAGTAPAPNVGHLEVHLAGEALGVADRLDVSLTKLAVSSTGDMDTLITRYHGEQWVDLVAAETPIPVLALQVTAGNYGALHMEFGAAHTTLAAQQHEAGVPEPSLAVFVPFVVERGGKTTITLTFGVEESLLVGLDGLEFRPVVTQGHVGDDNGGDLLDRYPPQQRSGGAWMPSLAGVKHDALAHSGLAGAAPGDLEAIRPEEIDPTSLAAPEMEESLVLEELLAQDGLAGATGLLKS